MLVGHVESQSTADPRRTDAKPLYLSKTRSSEPA